MLATAWTVVEGSDPVSFDVEILGVLPDGIAPGVDFILVHTSGSVIDESWRYRRRLLGLARLHRR